MKPSIKKVFENVHMGLGHIGLAKLIEKESGIKVEKLAQGDLILCLNRRGDKLKMLGHQGMVLAYLKMPQGQRIMKEALQFIPATFGGTKFDYDLAVRRAISLRLAGWMPKRRGPLVEAGARKAAGL